MTTKLINPQPFLLELVGKPIIVRLKWNIEYRGYLVSCDQYMNLQLASAEEWSDNNAFQGNLGEIFIRCNNVLFIRAVEEELTTNKK